MNCILCQEDEDEEQNQKVCMVLACGDRYHSSCAMKHRIFVPSIDGFATQIDCANHSIQNITQELPEKDDASLGLDIDLLLKHIRRTYNGICVVDSSVFKSSLDDEQQIDQILQSMKQTNLLMIALTILS